MVHNLVNLALAAAAAAVAGAINALAGGGTLVTFPVLTALGLPAISANVTNTVALLPGYRGGAWAQAPVLARSDQRRRLRLFIPAALLGGLLGALLLLLTGEKAFRSLVPYLILLAAALLAFGERIKRLIASRSGRGEAVSRAPGCGPDTGSVFALGAASVYGGYFGAGVSVIILAVLGIALDESLSELNALKQAISLACNLAAALFFAFSGRVDWVFAGVMAASALGGGTLGGALAGRLKSGVLRGIVVSAGVIVAAYYLIRG
jgi:uncharacterized protein